MGCTIRKELYATVEVPGESLRARRNTMRRLKRIGAQNVFSDPEAKVVTAQIECGHRQGEEFVCGGTAFEGAGFSQPTRCGSCFIRNR